MMDREKVLEAMARAMHTADIVRHLAEEYAEPWERLSDNERKHYRDDAVAALYAALPLILPEGNYYTERDPARLAPLVRTALRAALAEHLLTWEDNAAEAAFIQSLEGVEQ